MKYLVKIVLFVWIILYKAQIVFALNFCCSCLCIFTSMTISLVSWIHYWRHYSIGKTFIVSPPFFTKPWLLAKPAENLRCSWLFSASLSITMLWYHITLVRLLALRERGRPAKQHYHTRDPKTLNLTVTNALTICWWTVHLTDWAH